MTTEPSRRSTSSPRPRIALSPLEWRLLLTSALATTYLVAWLAFGTTLPTRTVSAAVERRGARTPLEPAPAVWFDDLPREERPRLDLPPGWRLASPDATASAPRLVRASAARPARVRTRSS